MRKPGRWAILALIMSLCAAGGCGGKEPDKAAGKAGGAAPAANAAPAGDASKTATSTAGVDPVKPESTGMGTDEPVKANTPPAAASTPTKSTIAGPAPVLTKIDPVVQKKVQDVGATLAEKSAKKAAAGGLHKNDFKQIGIAFHNFHDTMNHFPALNGNGDKDVPQPGLSWRVYLLPFLDQGALYNEFKLDEAWDSEHNKALIERMPNVYGQNKEGKTRVQVFTGEGAPFKNDLGVGLRDILDGSSNTIMCVEAAEDQAAIWTKPGGLEFDPQDPFKCLGTIGDQFLVTMMDGSVRNLKKTIPPKQLGFLIQHADGNPIDDTAIEGDAPEEVGPKLVVADPVTPLEPATARADLSFIPTSTFAAITVHPRRIYSHSVAKALRDQLPAEAFDPESQDLPFPARMGLDQATEVGNTLGIAPQNLDEVTILIDKSVPEAAMSGFQNGPPLIGVIVRNSAPIDVEGAITALASKMPSAEVQEFEGVSLLFSPNENVCVAFITDSMFIAGHIDFVKSMISAREQATATSGLTQRLDSIGNKLFVLAIDGKAVENVVKQLANDIPPPVSLFSSYIVGAKEVALSFDLDAPEMLQLSLQFKNSQLATGLFGMVEGQWKSLTDQYDGMKAFAFSDPASAPLQPYADQLVAETKLIQDDDSIVFTIPKVKDMELLPERLKPAVEAAKKAAERAQHKNNLKMIGLAFHNYHDTYVKFPALDGPADKDQPHPGLSWRVYLLPYVEEAALYNEFNLEEAWDSEQNKALIARMPKIYGKNKEGKSSIHVFTGEGAPFKKGEGTGISQITDGTSNTFLAVEAGDDVAEIWTKPGGLEFDPKNPLKCLGAIKEFNALMMDGSVRYLQNLDPETIGRLIQHADGQVLGDF